MGSPPIESRLGDFRRRVRRLISVYGTCWFIVVTLGIIVASALADWLIDLSTGVRVILLLSLGGASVWTAYRLLISPLLIRLRNVDLALQVESHFPALNDQLASAVEFVEEPMASDRSGSPALKAVVVDQVTRRLAAFDFGK